jgi:2-oxo-4-hydroxy-4-carboxy-5-ureidoimidazoline decarboxylase
MTQTALAAINALDRASFIALLGRLYEHSPWAAERAFSAAPFADAQTLADAFQEAVTQASDAERLALIRAHPELAGDRLRARALTTASMSEQASIGLDRLSESEIAEWTSLNAAYRETFDFPFLICVRLHTKAEILAALRRRLSSIPEQEVREAIAQIHDIARLRLTDLLNKLGNEP